MAETTERIDWFRVLVQCQRAGSDLYTVSRETGISHSLLRGYMAISYEPAHWRGELILKHWSSVTGKGQDSAPRVKR